MSEMPGVSIVTTDQCMHGLLSKDKNGEKVPARKTTRFMTSSLQMANLLQTRCDKGHLHQPLEGSRCAEAAYYPLKQIRTILQGMRNTKDAKDQLRNDAEDYRSMVNALSDASGRIPAREPATHTSKIPKVIGGHMLVTYSPDNFCHT